MADAEMKSKVLLVDDDEQILRSLRVYLELEKYQVDTARNGKEALERLEESKPEIMVTWAMRALRLISLSLVSMFMIVIQLLVTFEHQTSILASHTE